MTDEQEMLTAAAFREYQEGRTARDSDVEDWTGLIRDEKIARQMAIRSMHYEPERWDRPDQAPGDVADLEKHRSIIRAEASEVGRQALENGDMPTLKHMTGDTNHRADISGIKAIGEVDELVAGAAPVVVVLGRMGAGKSDFAGLLGQRWRDHHPEGVVASNIRSLKETDRWEDDQGDVRDGWIQNYPDMKEWLRQDGEPTQHSQTPKLFIADEMSSEASGVGKQGHDTRMKMGPLIYKIRKYGGALVVIAHGESSVHPLMWRVGAIVKKTGKKTATVAERIKNGELRDRRTELDGIPKTDWRLDTNEASTWSWDREDDDSAATMSEMDVKRVSMWTMVKCREQGMSNRETAEFVPYSHATVGNWLEEHDDGGEKREWVSDVEAAIA